MGTQSIFTLSTSTNMKLAILITFLPLAFSEISIEKSKASEFLQRAKRSPIKHFFAGAGDKIKETGSNIGQGIKNAGKGVGQAVDDYFTNNLESIEAWEEWKDSLEELPIPEAEVDALESCIFRCNAKDHALDFTGNSFEEKRETYEEAKDQGMNSQRPVPCPQCCEKIPKSLGDIQKQWPQIAGTCNIAADDDANLGK